ncbi:MAG: hypothetical protein CMN77_09995 [Spirochaetaceae bacterium]|nr:hypothetical protein [Spirochaetaceae bacterium]|tara:strand:+ start:86463 stop:86780 length:318 start_codon:yes stop_codon:yes gene_type:complete
MQLCAAISSAYAPYEAVERMPPPASETIPYMEFAAPSESRPRESILVERCKILDDQELNSRSALDFTGHFNNSAKEHPRIIIVSGSGVDGEPFQAMHRCFYIYAD